MILVTGATGTIGADVVKGLAAKGSKTRALVRSRDKAKAFAGRNVEVAVGDLDDPSSLDGAFAGVAKLFLLSPGDPRQVALQRNAIQAAKKAGVGHVVKLSALGAAPDAKIALGRWHAETEAEIRASGLPFTFLQPHSFMQNTLAFAATTKAENAFYAPMKNGAISMIDTRDIADAAVAALTSAGHEGKTYVLTGPEAVSYHDVAAKLSAATGRTIRYVDVPPEAAKQGMLGAGLPEWLANDLVSLYAVFAAGHAASVSPAVRELTGAPGRTYEGFARDFAAAF